MQMKARKIGFSKRLRKHMTNAESVLWKELRNRKCGEMKFRRQVPIDWYIADFLCYEHMLIIEVDGGIHNEQMQYDNEREEDLRMKGFTVLRFSNEQVLNNLSTVLSTICEAPLSRVGDRRSGRGAGGEGT